MFESFGVTMEKFLNHYWRKQPLVLRNGAHLFSSTLGKEEFLNAARHLKEELDGAANFAGETVVFCENLSSAVPWLADRADQLGRMFGVWHKCWFDGSYSMPLHGIGRHFDDSDNFVLQQTGRRLWVLGSPTMIDEQDRQKRTRHEPGAGACQPFDNATYVVLEPNDVLYLPIFFPHWGVSLEESVSITFAIQSISANYAIFPLLREVLRDDPAWWNPMPAHAKEVVSPIFLAQLGKALRDPALPEKLVGLWYERAKEEGLHTADREWVPDEFSCQPIEWATPTWRPQHGITELTNHAHDDNKKTSTLTEEEIARILSGAKEQTINDFRALLRSKLGVTSRQ